MLVLEAMRTFIRFGTRVDRCNICVYVLSKCFNRVRVFIVFSFPFIQC